MSCGHRHTFVNELAEGCALVASQPIGQASSTVVPQLPLPVAWGRARDPFLSHHAPLGCQSAEALAWVERVLTHTRLLSFVLLNATWWPWVARVPEEAFRPDSWGGPPAMVSFGIVTTPADGLALRVWRPSKGEYS